MPFQVMVVDDEDDLREPVVEYLREHGLEVVEANGGRQVDDALARRVPDVAVLDVNMPGESGFSIARRLRQAFGETMGIVMLTARRDLADRVSALEGAADDYMTKPFEPQELLARIRSVHRRLPRPAEVPPAKADFETEFWVEGLHGALRLDVDDIDWIEAAKDYVLLHTQDRAYMIRTTMAALEAGLDPARVMRVHRSAFVRVAAIAHINEVGRQATLVLKSGVPVKVGPGHTRAVKARLTAMPGGDTRA